jgi:hypothetical protein
MSYCRWSTRDRDDQCDLYCYTTGTGDSYTTGNTYITHIRHSIDLPHAGGSFEDSSLEAFKARLLYLRSIGYHFPDCVLDEIGDEIRERDRPK